MTTTNDKYEKRYRHTADLFGPPFAAIIDFFDQLTGRPMTVLDLGCGQGRDALPIARRGHAVTGVDIAPTGVEQMLAAANREELAVEGVVADILHFQPTQSYDVIVLDRVLHMLSSDAERLVVLSRATRHTRPGGAVLIADTVGNMPLLHRFLQQAAGWRIFKRQNGFLFVRRAAK